MSGQRSSKPSRDRYEEDYRRSNQPPVRRVHEETVSSREDRHRTDRGEAREKRTLEESSRSERTIRPSERETRERVEREPERMDYTADTRMGPQRGDPRANMAAPRGGDSRETRETITVYRDPATGQLRDAKTHEILDPPAARQPLPRRHYDDDDMMMDDAPPSRRRGEREQPRDMYDPPARGTTTRDPRDGRDTRDGYDDYGRGPSRQQGYGMNEFFVDGSGIEREVIQHDICRYLGNDATVRRGIKDGRDGYIVRAYRALTSAQLEDLRQDSSKYRRSQRSGRGSGPSYAEMRARDEPGYTDVMDVDMDEYPPPSRGERHRELEPRGERIDRHARAPPVTSSGYGETSYPTAYALGTGQAPYSAAQMPRSVAAGGNYSPQGARSGQSTYPASSYDSRSTAAPVTSLPPAQVYKDPRTGQFVAVDPGYGAGFASDPSRSSGRHGR